MAMIKSFRDSIEEHSKRIDYMEQMGGKDLIEPYSITNSSSRKLMLSSNTEQILGIVEPEEPLQSTGYEIEFGRYCSSLVKSDDDYDVVAKVPKYPLEPDLYYYLILKSKTSNHVTCIERISYNHNTESYGYLINNQYLDSLQVGSVIPKDRTVQKSNAYNQQDIRCDGLNVPMAYMNLGLNLEDGILIAKSYAKKFAAPLIKKVSININDNDIPLNLHGNIDVYKIIPDIGEYIKGDILCAIRREKTSECLYTQSYDKLREMLISDEKFTVHGKVIDINVQCNNPDLMVDNIYHGQMKYYNDVCTDFAWRLTAEMKRYIDNDNFVCSYEMLKTYDYYDKITKGYQYMKDNKVSSFTILDVTVLELRPLEKGDKLTDRYGGKGVISAVVPDELMPRYGDNNIVGMIMNSATCVNRLNPGQLFETSNTFSGDCFLRALNHSLFQPEEEFDIYLKYLSHVAPKQHVWMSKMFDNYSSTEKAMYLDSLRSSGGINICADPMSEGMSVDKLAMMYNDLDFIDQYWLYVPIRGSNGTVRYVKSRRKITIGKKYTYRLKQYAEEKFSVTSLSSTNIKNENSRSRASKMYKAMHSSTPKHWMGLHEVIHVENLSNCWKFLKIA